MGNTDVGDLRMLIEELRADIRRVSDRIERLEASQSAVMVAPFAESEPPVEGISEEILLVISAAVAAFLGERAHIRQVRLTRSSAWAQQGRVSIQASHYLQL